MIRSFADQDTERLSATGTSRRLPRDIVRRALSRLKYLHLATCPEDLREPLSNHLEVLGGDRAGQGCPSAAGAGCAGAAAGQWSVRINNQWRLCFRFEGGDAFDVEIVHYH